MTMPPDKQSIGDPILGSLTWNDRFDWWEARVELKPGLTVNVHGQPGHDVAATLATGREVLLWLRGHEPDARNFAAGKLLDTHNDSWNEGAPISAQAFAERMGLESVGVDPDGCGTLYYEDGDLFWGHCIVVSMDQNRAFKGADIAG